MSKFSTIIKSFASTGDIDWLYVPLKNYRVTNVELEDGGNVKKYSLTNFNTDELKYDVNNPVDIIPQYSYDGSINLILNDGAHTPRLINSRFSTKDLKTYEIVDRKGENDTNIYDLGEQFDIDTSLFKRVNNIQKIDFKGVYVGGNLKVGNYFFYFKLADADGNESPFIGQSGLVSIFLGSGNPHSSQTGMRDLNSHKYVKFKISNIDTAYDHVVVYYTRSSAEGLENLEHHHIKILLKFLINKKGVCNLTIFGNENTQQVSSRDILNEYVTIDAVKAQAANNNVLFLGNVHKTDIPYTKLTLAALHMLPKPHITSYTYPANEKYAFKSTDRGYYDPKNIHDFTGYWPDEYYRFGVVFILKSGDITPVFNIRGGLNIDKDSEFSEIADEVTWNESTYIVDSQPSNTPHITSENVKGVCSFKVEDSLLNILGVTIDIDDYAKNIIKEHCKGFFFVRLKRIPNILCQGINIGIEQESHLPVIPTKDGILGLVLQSANTTHLVWGEKNYVTEGFLSRYQGKWILRHLLFSLKNIATMAISYIAAGVVGAIATATSALIKNNRKRTYEPKVNGWKIEVPALFKLGEDSNSRKVGGSFNKRLIVKSSELVSNSALFCPDYEVNLVQYNSLFTGNEHIIRQVNTETDDYFTNKNDRHFFNLNLRKREGDIEQVTTKVIGVPDNVKIVGIDNYKFRARAGEPEDASKFAIVGNEYKAVGDSNDGKVLNSDIVRGSFGSYIGVSTELSSGLIYNIYSSTNALNYDTQLTTRINDNSPYYSVSLRISLQDLEEANSFNFYNGDSYLCQVTHRVLRNFNDPSSLYNDEIVDENTWRDHYNPEKPDSLGKINIGDVNAVQLGMWVTFRVRSSYNLNIRTVDESHAEEKSMSGRGRGYYPYHPMSTEGSYKIPESDVYNKGFSVSVNNQPYFVLPDVPAIKNWFGTRIMYSNKHINDAFRNGYRVFKPTAFRDYTREYGSITKLVSYGNDLIAVMEHGILRIPINTAPSPENTSLTTLNILPEIPQVISPDYGTIWKESVISTPSGIYGLDTEAKKIWRYNGQGFDLISENNIQEFLNLNIILLLGDKGPIIETVNVKTFYNAFKGDIMFTFYNFGDGAKTIGSDHAWNICYNEKLGVFTTFYSWIPSMMENIDNIPISTKLNTLGTPDYRLWKHGQGGVIDNELYLKGNAITAIQPTHWYDEQHPFELEFIVNDKPGLHKIFDNLEIISNSAEPESFHYEVVGDLYDFAYDKLNMYIRLEATKHLYNINGADISYNSKYTKMGAKHYPMCDMYGNAISGLYKKSTIFPLYYSRLDPLKDLNDYYQIKSGYEEGKDYDALAGAEIVYYQNIDEYRILNHVKAVDITDPSKGRLRGNMHYKESTWLVLINPINFVEYNEDTWENNKIPVVLNYDAIPLQVKDYALSQNGEIKLLDNPVISWPTDETRLLEAKPKDKWMKVRIRYKGDRLAVISAIRTLYSISMA